MCVALCIHHKGYQDNKIYEHTETRSLARITDNGKRFAYNAKWAVAISYEIVDLFL